MYKKIIFLGLAILIIFIFCAKFLFTNKPSCERLVDLLTAGKYETAEAYLNELKSLPLDENNLSPLWSIMASIPAQGKLIPYLDEWCNRSPNLSYAYALRGAFYINYAWQARGSGWVNQVSNKELDSFHDRLKQAKADLLKATTLEPVSGFAFQQLIRVLAGLGRQYASEVSLKDEMNQYFEKAIALEPKNYHIYESKLWFLTPKWHGSEQELLDFSRTVARNAPIDTIIPLILFEAHYEIFKNLDDDSYFSQPEVQRELDPMFKSLLAQNPRSNLIKLYYGLYSFLAKRNQEAKTAFLGISSFEYLPLEYNEWQIRQAMRSLQLEDKMIDLYKDWIHQMPWSTEAPTRLAFWVKKTKGWREAKPYFERAKDTCQKIVDENPSDKDAIYNLASIYYELDPDLAIEYCQKLTKLAPNNSDGFKRLAETYQYKKKMYPEALSAYQKALELDPSDKSIEKEIKKILAKQ